MISKSAIHAFLARLAAPKITLAAFSIAFSFYYTVTSGTEVTTLVSISYLKDRRALLHLLGFFCLVLALPVGLTQVVAWTPVGAWFYGEAFGASGAVIAQAQLATFFLSLSAPILIFRATAFALIMQNRRTIWITWSTLLRLLSLGVSLVVLPRWLSGASVGAAALVACMAVEAGFAWLPAWRFFRALPASGEPLPRYGELWGFSWPLMLNQGAEMGIAMTINVFLGRLTSPDLALAAFGVVHGLAGVLLSPLRNLVHTAQTLTRSAEDVRVMWRFTHWLVLWFTLLAAGVFLLPPVRDWVLMRVMGLTAELATYSRPGVMVAFLVAATWGYSALFRGLLAGARRTGIIAAAASGRLVAVVALGGLTLLFPSLNGALFGMLLWGLSFLVDVGVLGRRLRRGNGTGQGLYG